MPDEQAAAMIDLIRMLDADAKGRAPFDRERGVGLLTGAGMTERLATVIVDLFLQARGA